MPAARRAREHAHHDGTKCRRRAASSVWRSSRPPIVLAFFLAALWVERRQTRRHGLHDNQSGATGGAFHRQSMAEVADSRKDHGDTDSVGGSDHFLVADRAAGLNDGGCARRRDRLQAIGEGEEGVGGGDTVGE